MGLPGLSSVPLAAPRVFTWFLELVGAIHRAATHLAAILRGPLHWASKHTGVPAVLLAALAIVILYRAARWSGRFFAEVSLVALTLAALAKLGFLAF